MKAEEICRFRMLCEVFGRVGATKLCRANAPKKTFVWFQTAFAWKVNLLSNTLAWIQNSFFGSLICRKKQLTRILDDSWKSIVLVPHSIFVSKCKKFRQNLSDGIRVRQRVKVFRNGRKKLSSFWEKICTGHLFFPLRFPPKIGRTANSFGLKPEKRNNHFSRQKVEAVFSRQKVLSWTTTKWCCFSTQCWFHQRIESGTQK